MVATCLAMSSTRDAYRRSISSRSSTSFSTRSRIHTHRIRNNNFTHFSVCTIYYVPLLFCKRPNPSSSSLNQRLNSISLTYFTSHFTRISTLPNPIIHHLILFLQIKFLHHIYRIVTIINL